MLPSEPASATAAPSGALTFKQQKELLLLQLEKSRIDQETEIERRRFEQESECAKY